MAYKTKEQAREANRRWRANNPDYYTTAQRDARSGLSGHWNTVQKQWRDSRPGHNAQWQRERNAMFPGRHAKEQTKWRRANPDLILQQQLSMDDIQGHDTACRRRWPVPELVRSGFSPTRLRCPRLLARRSGGYHEGRC